MISKDKAETGRIADSLQQIGQALDQYLKFEHPDAFKNKEQWQRQLNIPLPEKGVGLDDVISEINSCIIPNGSPITRPGFSSFITTGASTASVLATASSGIASPQRYLGTAFNYIEELSLEWMVEMFKIPHLKGIYSSGGSVANLVALGGARQAAFEAIGIDPAADGIHGPCIGRASISNNRHRKNAFLYV